MNNKCKGLFGFLFGHRITNIFDEESFLPNDTHNVNVAEAYYAASIIEQMRTNTSTYVKTICERCGQTINRL